MSDSGDITSQRKPVVGLSGGMIISWSPVARVTSLPLSAWLNSHTVTRLILSEHCEDVCNSRARSAGFLPWLVVSLGAAGRCTFLPARTQSYATTSESGPIAASSCLATSRASAARTGSPDSICSTEVTPRTAWTTGSFGRTCLTASMIGPTPAARSLGPPARDRGWSSQSAPRPRPRFGVLPHTGACSRLLPWRRD